MTPIETFFDAFEHTQLSLWMRGPSLLAFPTILTLHTIGMGFLAGTSAAVALRILGVARGVPLPEMQRIYPVLWTALALNFVSGCFLFAGYPYKAVTNPVFYVKLSLIALAVYAMVRIRREVLRDPRAEKGWAWPRAKALAAASLVLWAGAITAGRLLAYTYTWLRVGIPGGF